MPTSCRSNEPGQGNQGLRACTATATSSHREGLELKRQGRLRVQFTKTWSRDVPPSPTDPLGGGNELLWQLTGWYRILQSYQDHKGEHDDEGDDEDEDETRTRRSAWPRRRTELPRSPDGPPSERSGLFAGYDSGDRRAATVDLYDDAFAATFIQDLSNGGRAFAGSGTIVHLDRGIFDLVNLCGAGLFNIPGARTTDCEDVSRGSTCSRSSLEIPITDLFPDGIPHDGMCSTPTPRTPAARLVRVSRARRRS